MSVRSAMGGSNIWEGGLIEETGRSGPVEFGLDDSISDEVKIVPYNGRHREMMRLIPGLASFVKAIEEEVSRCAVVGCSFEWTDKPSGSPRHRRNVKATVTTGLPDRDVSPFAPFLFTAADLLLDSDGRRISEKLSPEALDVDFDDWRSVVESVCPGSDSHQILSFAPACIFPELREKSRSLLREVESSVVAGPIRDSFLSWKTGELRQMVHKSLSKYSDISNDLLHQFVDELAVKDVLET